MPTIKAFSLLDWITDVAEHETGIQEVTIH